MLEDSLDFGMKNDDKEVGFDYAWENAVYRTCIKINQIEYIKNNKPKYTKQELIEQHKKYYSKYYSKKESNDK